MEFDNFSKSENEYDTFHKSIGHKHNVSYRVIGVVRSHFYEHVENFSKLSDEDFVRQIILLRKKFKKRLTSQNEVLRPAKIELANQILRPESTLNSAEFRCNLILEKSQHLVHSLRKVSVSMAIIKFLTKMEKEPHILKEILGHTLNEK